MSRKAIQEKDALLGLRMKELRLEVGLSQREVGAVIDVERAAISKYEKGYVQNMQLTSIKKLAKFFNVSPLYLIGSTDDRNWRPSPKDLSESEFDRIRKYRACDTDGKKHVDYTLDREYNRTREFSVIREPHAEYFKRTRTIKVYDERAAAGRGNCLVGYSYTEMEFPDADIPPKTEFGVRISGDSMEPEIPDGCIVFIYPCLEVESGQIGIFCLNGDALCKRWEVNHTKQTVRLLSNNPAYPPREITPEDSFHTFGLVVGHTKGK